MSHAAVDHPPDGRGQEQREAVDAEQVAVRLREGEYGDGSRARAGNDEANLTREAAIWMLDHLAGDETLGPRLAAADTTIEVRLVDAPEPVVFSLLLDRVPVEATSEPRDDPEVHIMAETHEFARAWFGDGRLAMAIADGKIGYDGPVRKLLRVVPLMKATVPSMLEHFGEDVRALLSDGSADQPTETADGSSSAAVAAGAEGTNGDGSNEDAERRHAGEVRARRNGAWGDECQEDAEPGSDAARLLDQAAEYEGIDLHEGAVTLQERYPGEFWSIICNGVTKKFGPNHVLDGLDFYIPEGMITVVLGPSGTGKSVLINHLIGLMFPDEGELIVQGESLMSMTRSRLREMRKKFGILFQDGALFGSMTLFDNVAFPMRQHTDLGEDEIREKVEQRLAEVGLSDAMDRMPNEISGGMRKRAGFARALMLEPSIVLFDEPDSGLDPVRTALLCELIKRMHSEHGGTYVVITHDIASARQVGEYIAVLWKGRIVQAGDAERMFESDNPFVRQFLNRGLEGPLGME